MSTKAIDPTAQKLSEHFSIKLRNWHLYTTSSRSSKFEAIRQCSSRENGSSAWDQGKPAPHAYQKATQRLTPQTTPQVSTRFYSCSSASEPKSTKVTSSSASASTNPREAKSTVSAPSNVPIGEDERCWNGWKSARRRLDGLERPIDRPIGLEKPTDCRMGSRGEKAIEEGRKGGGEDAKVDCRRGGGVVGLVSLRFRFWEDVDDRPC